MKNTPLLLVIVTTLLCALFFFRNTTYFNPYTGALIKYNRFTEKAELVNVGNQASASDSFVEIPKDSLNELKLGVPILDLEGVNAKIELPIHNPTKYDISRELVEIQYVDSRDKQCKMEYFFDTAILPFSDWTISREMENPFKSGSTPTFKILKAYCNK